MSEQPLKPKRLSVQRVQVHVPGCNKLQSCSVFFSFFLFLMGSKAVLLHNVSAGAWKPHFESTKSCLYCFFGKLREGVSSANSAVSSAVVNADPISGLPVRDWSWRERLNENEIDCNAWLLIFNLLCKSLYFIDTEAIVHQYCKVSCKV